jgi:radical SAM superfamily enzyme YgiQ (UPF0313 family)
MKVLLVSANTAASPYPVFPLGAAVVVNALRRAGHEVEFVDWLAEGRSPEALGRRTAETGPDIIAVAIRNIDNVNSIREERYLDRAAEVVAVLRAASRAPILLGGAGFSLMPEAILRRVGGDFGIVGEGERAIVEFLEAFSTAKPPRFTIVRQSGLLEPARMGGADYSLSCAGYYIEHGGMVGVQTKRGCPHACAYCTYPLLEGRSLRPRPPAAVVDDIQQLIDKGMAYLFFVDAVFNDERGLYMDVIREMRARRVSVRWTAYFAPRAVSDSHLDEMVETGLSAAEVGSDAATDETLRGMGKPHTWDQVRAFDSALRRRDVPVAHYFIFGGPGETEGTLKAGIANVRSLEGTVRFILSGVRVLPGTAIAAMYRNPDGTAPTHDDLVEPRYYFSPSISRERLEAMLREGFADSPLCLYPPEKGGDNAVALHRKGFCGPMWEMLLGRRSPRRVRRHD